MKPSQLLLLTEQPPLQTDQPATGLAVRHTRMARNWQTRGCRVTYAWPAGNEPNHQADLSSQLDLLPLHTPDELQQWSRQYPDAVYLLGYWELAEWLPPDPNIPLVLDYIAPRLLERSFEQSQRLNGDMQQLIPLLSRCCEVWVGNQRQHDLMLGLMLMAGHRLSSSSPVRIVPIAAPLHERDRSVRCSDAGDRPIRVFHGGRDWPWRNTRRWLQPLTDLPDVELVDAGQGGRWYGFDDYLAELDRVDVVLELADDNVERRFSQSFRASDALSRGVPVICNRFVPLARWIEHYGAGWVIDRPEQLPELLGQLKRKPELLDQAAACASELARSRLDAVSVYGDLLDVLAELAVSRVEQPVRQAVLPASRAEPPESGRFWRSALGEYAGAVLHRLLGRPVQRLFQHWAQNRPQAQADRACWVIVSRSDLFPTNHGAAVKIERTAWGLSHHLDEVLLLTDNRKHYWVYTSGERSRRSFPLWLRALGWPRSINLLRVMMQGVPYSNAFLYLPLVDRAIKFRLLWLLRQRPVEVVQAEFPAYAKPALWAQQLFGTRSLLVEHNVEFQRIAEQEPKLSNQARRRLEAIEIELAQGCERVVTVSQRDRQALIAAGVEAKQIRTIPHGVDLDAFANAEPVDLRARYDIPADHALLVYHGIYSYPPNFEAVEELSRSLLPRLKLQGMAATVLAIGPEPSDQPLDGVVFTGPADDLAGYLKSCDLAVIPLRDGGGTRMKILDDFAAGVPVVTTRKGMEGIPVEHGKQLLIVDDPAEMAEAVVDLLTHPEKRRVLSDNARAWVSEFDWREIARRYVEFVRSPL